MILTACSNKPGNSVLIQFEESPTGQSTETLSPPSAIPKPSPTATPDVPFEQISFVTEDNIEIVGTIFGIGQGDLVVLMLHMGLGNCAQESWHPMARLLAEKGYSVLTIDFRGRGGSGG